MVAGIHRRSELRQLRIIRHAGPEFAAGAGPLSCARRDRTRGPCPGGSGPPSALGLGHPAGAARPAPTCFGARPVPACVLPRLPDRGPASVRSAATGRQPAPGAVRSWRLGGRHDRRAACGGARQGSGRRSAGTRAAGPVRGGSPWAGTAWDLLRRVEHPAGSGRRPARGSTVSRFTWSGGVLPHPRP